MSIYDRATALAEEEDIDAAPLEEEFDNIDEAFNGLFRADRVSASGLLTLTTSFADVPGASLSITTAVPSLLLVNAVADFENLLSAAGEQQSIGVLNVDGTDRGEELISGFPIGAIQTARETVAQAFCISLTAGAHTIKLRAKCGGTHTSRAHFPGTGFTYLLIPQP